MKIVKQLLKEGVNKKDIFDKASKEGLNPKKVSKYLAMYPDPEESKKYNRANNIFIGIYSVLVLLNIFELISILPDLHLAVLIGVFACVLFIPGIVISSIYKKQSTGYLILSILLFNGTLRSFEGYESEPVGVLVSIVINICMIVYVLLLKKKLFPYQNFFNTRKNDKGIAIFMKDINNQVDLN